MALDLASSEFFQAQQYHCDGHTFDAQAWVKQLSQWAQKWPICSLEDPCDENDWATWSSLTQALPEMQIVGDDLFVTQTKRLNQGVACHAANAVLIKPNQVGTLSETLDCIASAHAHGYRAMLSHRLKY